jgi:glucose-6-phosphate 1-dehydrogenase
MVREAIGEIIGQPQQARLEQAQRRRDAFRREANVLVVVSLLDEPLALSAEQRQQLTETLREQWEAAELFAAEHYLMNQEYVPNLPARLLKDVLTAEQRRVWNSLQQVTFTMQISPPQQEQWND